MKLYGSYSDADLNDWERFPSVARVLTSSAFGAWLMRRDEQMAKQNTGMPTQRWIPVSEKYEHHVDHTDCIWYGNDSGCPVTCSQYRDGWNDAMEYIFKDGKGYQPYRRDIDG
jgi:hypothetical protein